MNRLFGNFRIILLFLTAFCFAAGANAMTASEAFSKTKAKLSGVKTLSADFILKADGQSFSGNIYSKGKKFAIISNGNSSWYNGKDLYTYSPASRETYVFTPSASELMEANPLLYINSSSDFKVQESKKELTGLKRVVLVPTGKKTGVKSVTVDIDVRTFLPKTITVILSSGQRLDLTVKNIKLNGDLKDSTFEYPKSKYSNVPLTDMR